MAVEPIGRHPDYRSHRLPGVATGGGPPHDDGMLERLAKVETAIEHMQARLTDLVNDLRDLRKAVHTNFLWVLGAIGATFAFLMLALAHGFHWF